ncbi:MULTISPECIES: flagellar hook protein FlgE [unclassified Aminobacter]|uniref:flagellar hook protein FlgE n=2 Tax=Aminobacter TaxID=31988 RepID=UPI0004642E22|nr:MULTISPECIES: flagellar hook protein FlgE [unclassified Aminobacter]TWG49371.1 flagellar hook protein FlgE [Aminobacter sp. J44]TWH23420.1 flagellar hook protein FlgE [Aminobacter sp. J15]
MSLYGMMRTGVSGMNAQATRLATVADNIANSGTHGYKKASVAFSSLVVPNTGTSYVSGGISTQVRYDMSAGNLQYTTSVTDLAIDGNGFFVVQDAAGKPFLSRAASFIPDGNGNLVNAAGYYLMGRSYALGEPGTTTTYGDYERVTIPTTGLERVASTMGKLASNLPFDAPVYAPMLPAPGDVTKLPSANPANDADIRAGMEAGSIFKSGLTAIGYAGEAIRLDIYFTKIADNQWEVAVFYQPDASTATAFPYIDPVTGAPATAPLEKMDLTFDPTTGNLVAGSSTELVLDLRPAPAGKDLNGERISVDLSDMRQLATDYTPLAAEMNGSRPSAIDRIVIDEDGILSVQYANGAMEKLYRLDLAYVQSPDQLSVLPGNVFQEGLQSGQVKFGKPNEISLGAVKSGAVENSNVDIAEELTNMIESQRNYTANSKVFQTGGDLMDVLVNLKR